MDDGSSEAPDPLRTWLEATGGGDARGGTGPSGDRGPGWRLLTLTGVVTVVALTLGAMTVGRAASGTPAAIVPPAVASSPASEAPALALAPAPAPSPAVGQAGGSEGDASPQRPVEPASGELIPAPPAAAAVLAVRTAAGSDEYVDTAIAERLEPGDGFAVVTVLAWVLHRDGTRWDRGRARRYGVALDSAGTGPVVLAPPWPLPRKEPRPRPIHWQPLDDNQMVRTVAGALRDAGYRSLQELEVRSDAALPGVVSAAVTALAPGDAAPQTHEVWLSPDATTVLGAPRPTDLPIPGAQP